MIEKLKHSKMTRKSKEEQISSTKKIISSSLFSFQYFSLSKQKTESETLKKFKERITKNRVSVVCENKFVCADAFYLSLSRKEYTDAFRIRVVFCLQQLLHFLPAILCLLVLLSFWESSIALKSYRFLACAKKTSPKKR